MEQLTSKHTIVRCAASVLALAVGLAALPAFAQTKGPPPTSPPADSKPSKSNIDEAKTRYDRGAQLYQDGDFKLALIEFQRSYDLAPSYKVLYNIGEVQLQLNQYASALKTFQKYLSDGGKEIAAKRRAEVEHNISMLQTRTAHVDVISNVEGTEISIDDAVIGTTPLPQGLLVDAGDHKIVAKAAGHISATKQITLAGSDEVKVEFELPKQQGPVPVVVQPVAERTIIQQSDGRTSYVWVGWLLTGVLVAGATATGVTAIAASNDLKNARNDPMATRKTLDDAQNKARAFAVATDVIAGCAVIAGGVSLIFSIKGSGSEEKKQPAHAQVNLRLLPNGGQVDGTF